MRQVTAAAAALVMLTCAAVGAIAAPVSVLTAGAALVVTAYDSDEALAQQMVEWIRGRGGREPTQAELNRSERLRTQWDAYVRMRQRARDNEKYLIELRKRQDEERKRLNEERAKNEYQKALDLFAKKDYDKAVKQLFAVRQNNDFATYHADADAKLQEIDQLAQTEIGEAKTLATSGNYDEAIKRLTGVGAKFGRDIPSVKSVGKEIDTIKKSPDYVAKMKKNQAANLLKQAEGAYASKRYGNAAAIFEQRAAQYADQEEGRTGKTKLDEMKANAEIWNLAQKDRAEGKAKELLGLATSYINLGMKDKAEPKLKEIVEKYPETEAAVEARKLLGLPPAPSSQPTSKPAAEVVTMK